MNEILQKRIEEAAKKAKFEFYNRFDWSGNQETGFNEGCRWLLNNLWISIDEALPECDRCCLAMYEDGGIIVAKYEDRDWWWQDGFVVGRNSQGDLMYSSSCKVPDGLITHWMMIPTINKEEK